MPIQWRPVVLAIAAVVVFATGFLLARFGRPYGTGLLTIHKLVDLAGVVFVGVVISGALRGGGASGSDWGLVIAALIVAIAMFASGGMISASPTPAPWIVLGHRWLPWPLVALLGVVVYRLAER